MKNITTAEMIHADFDTSADRLLNEAREIIATHDLEKSMPISKKELLHFWGFDNVPYVKNENTGISKELAELILYYRREYPFHKFITEDDLNTLCEKYNLIYAPVNAYIKDIPTLKLKEINESKYLSSTDAPEYVRNGADKKGLFIAAPKSHFDLKGLSKLGKFLFSKIIPEPKDPIVFRFVRGGIQVLAKWGDEANDSILLNERYN